MASKSKARLESATNGKASIGKGKGGDPETPRCLAIAKTGIKTSIDFAAFCSAAIYDVAADQFAPNKANACFKGGSLLLKVKEMEFRWGAERKGKSRMLSLAPAR